MNRPLVGFCGGGARSHSATRSGVAREANKVQGCNGTALNNPSRSHFEALEGNFHQHNNSICSHSITTTGLRFFFKGF